MGLVLQFVDAGRFVFLLSNHFVASLHLLIEIPKAYMQIKKQKVALVSRQAALETTFAAFEFIYFEKDDILNFIAYVACATLTSKFGFCW